MKRIATTFAFALIASVLSAPAFADENELKVTGYGSASSFRNQVYDFSIADEIELTNLAKLNAEIYARSACTEKKGVLGEVTRTESVFCNVIDSLSMAEMTCMVQVEMVCRI